MADSPTDPKTPAADHSESSSQDNAASAGEARPRLKAAGQSIRRSPRVQQLFGASVAITVVSTGLVWHFLSTRLEELATRVQSHKAKAFQESDSVSGDQGGEGSIKALQAQLDAWRRDQLASQKELREAIERVASTRDGGAAAVPVAAAGILDGQGQVGVSRLAEVMPNVTPTQAEFIQLKERNRITAYADEAIATGNRKPLETLVEYIRGSGSSHLRDAAQAEYMRVVRMIQFFQREDPGYRLPVGELFKGEPVQYEADLKAAQLFQLLENIKHPWEVRVRAAILLRASEAPQTNAKLIHAIKKDPSLEVAKHAQISLEQRIQRRFRLFDIPAIEVWEKEQQAVELPKMRP